MDVNRKIIEFVRLHKFIYDPTDPHYGENGRKTALWRDIASRLQIPEKECKKSWHLLREGYRRVLKKRLTAEKDPVFRKDKEIKKWIYEDDLSFLFPHLKFWGHVEVNCTQNNNNQETKSPEKQKELTQNVTVQKRLHLKRSRTNDGNARQPCSHETTSNKLVKYILDKTTQRSDTHQFFDSMAATVLTFSPRDRAVAKAKVFEVISKMEIEILDREHIVRQSKRSSVSSVMDVLETSQDLHSSLLSEAPIAEFTLPSEAPGLFLRSEASTAGLFLRSEAPTPGMSLTSEATTPGMSLTSEAPTARLSLESEAPTARLSLESEAPTVRLSLESEAPTAGLSLTSEAPTAGLSELYNSEDDEEVIVMNVKVEPEEFLEMSVNQKPNT